MKITFVVPGLNLTGGLRVISIYADLLSKRGHEVTVVSPSQRIPSFKEKIKSFFNWKGYKFQTIFDDSFFENSNFEVNLLKKNKEVTASDVPDADVIIATFWITAEWVALFPPNKGRKVYFIQHHEIHYWLPNQRVKATFSLPFKKIVVAKWLASIMENDYQQDDVSIVTNAVDHELFYSPERSKNEVTVFGTMYSQRQYKGTQLAFDAFCQLKRQRSDIKLIVFGIEPSEKVERLPIGAQYFSRPNQEQIREVYNQCDAWLFTSSSEGFGLPILEALSCRTPVIGTRSGAAPDLLSSGGGILVDIGDVEGLLSAMEYICNLDNKEWENMSNSAYKEALAHRWEEKVVEFEKVISIE
ncbi:MAG: glycosyl transferase family 1 [Cycloclasticus sp.]|nr:glycosyl transferase family 1 [Cycloclasticus sp.]MBG95245.1 glycosyl transferase family 1 [Cycloclasticus sp.]